MNNLVFGYNTNGFAHHRLDDALDILITLGYQSVALTLDHHVLNPFDRPGLAKQLPGVKRRLRSLRPGAAIETGARFLLDPYRKHQPTLLSPPRQRVHRVEFLRHAIDLAAELRLGIVSFWSGSLLKPEPPDRVMRRLADACRTLADHAAMRRVQLAFEPEPGMFIDTMDRFAELFDRVNHPAFGLTIDIGHLHCQGELPIEQHLRRWIDVLWNIHIEDMRRGVHDHLMFGEGEIEFAPVLRTLRELDFTGGIHVELSRHSHDAVETARRALAFLRQV